MSISLHIDDIIYRLQRTGGISVYWQEMTSRIAKDPAFTIRHSRGSKATRMLPIISRGDLFHSSYFRTPLSVKTKIVVTVYDFLYELGWLSTKGGLVTIWQKKQAIRAADVIICISEQTKRDLLAIYPDVSKYADIHVVYLGKSFSIDHPASRQKCQRFVTLQNIIPDRYVLFVGGRSGYKNFTGAATGFARSSLPQQGFSIVCTGTRFTDSEMALLNTLGLQDRAIALDQATYDELNYLYQHAFALVYPSLYEGFGLPPLEAMSCGCPVIVSNTSSLPEVVGNAGILIDPSDPVFICDALERLCDRTTRLVCKEKGVARSKLFDWDITAEKHIEVYKSLVPTDL